MADARDVRVVLAAVALAVLPTLGSCHSGAGSVTPADGRTRADWLASSYARHVGAGDRGLDRAGELALGESGLHYDVAHDALVGRVFVQRGGMANAPASDQINLRRMVAALNDPRVGGMFDRAGASFVFDEPRDGFYLERAFPVAATSPDQLAAGMDRMVAVAAPWVVDWFFQVAMVMHGHRPPPARFTALEDRPR